jgi:hypothetical protein
MVKCLLLIMLLLLMVSLLFLLKLKRTFGPPCLFIRTTARNARGELKARNLNRERNQTRERDGGPREVSAFLLLLTWILRAGGSSRHLVQNRRLPPRGKRRRHP